MTSWLRMSATFLTQLPRLISVQWAGIQPIAGIRYLGTKGKQILLGAQ
jgi:hypothetical protein